LPLLKLVLRICRKGEIAQAEFSSEPSSKYDGDCVLVKDGVVEVSGVSHTPAA
jgi:hypothetical protein